MFGPSFKFANYVNHEEAEAFVVSCEVILSLDNIDQKKTLEEISYLGIERISKYTCLLNGGVKQQFIRVHFLFYHA